MHKSNSLVVRVRIFLSLLLLSFTIVLISGCKNVNTTWESPSQSQSLLSESPIQASPTIITQSPTPSPNVFNLSNNTEDFNNNVMNKENQIPLIAAIKSENIYLYGIYPYGVILYQNNIGTYYDWLWITPRLVLPELAYQDFDSDGKKELAITLYVGSGTGYSIRDLHLLHIDDTKDESYSEYTDYCLSGFDVDSWFDNKFTFSQEKDSKIVNVKFDNKDYTVNIGKEDSDSGPIENVVFGDFVDFKFDGQKIKAIIEIGFIYKNWVSPQFFGNVEATVNFSNKQFSLSDYNFTLDNSTTN